MKKILLSAAIAFAVLSTTDSLAQVGFGTNTPEKSSAVEITSTKRGLLIPRIDLTLTTIAAPVSQPAQSLLVYNKNTAGDVTPGFYYWDANKWVRFTSSTTEKTSSVIAGNTTTVTSLPSTENSNNTEYKVEVNEAALSLENIGGSLNPAQITIGTSGQVLVTKETAPGKYQTVWVDPSEVIGNGILVGDGLTKNGNEISLGGVIDSPISLGVVSGGSVKITGLNDGSSTFDASTDNIMIMKPDGTLEKASTGSIIGDAIADGQITGKALTSTDLDISENGATSLLKDVTVNIKTGAITSDKILDGTITGADIAPKTITNDKLDSGTALSGTVATSNGDGTVTYQTVAETSGKNLTTDDVIQITGAGATTSASATQSVLKDIKLEIGEDKITSRHIAENAITNSELDSNSVASENIQNGTIKPEDIEAPAGTNKVMVTDGNGVVTWIDQAGLSNKDNYTGSAPINISVGTQNATGGLDREITVATANAGTLGVVKEAATPTVNINAVGELSVNLSNVTLAGDVTGPLNATVISPNSVTTEKINDNAITTTKISDDAVTASKINSDVAGLGLQQNATTGALEVNVSEIGKNVITTSPAIVLTNANGAALTEMTIGFDQTKIAINANQVNGGTTGQVMVVDATNKGSWVDANTLGNTVTANNGLTKAENTIKLGGALIEATNISTDIKNTLAISGLQDVASTNDIMVVEKDGKLRKVARSISATTTSTLAVNSIAGYTPYVQEINISATAGATNFDINLPAPTADNNGQVINVKLNNTIEADGYVSVKSGATELTYGALPYQGWILKSNGQNWLIVGRN